MCGVQFLKEMDVEIRRNFDKERDVNIEPRRQDATFKNTQR